MKNSQKKIRGKTKPKIQKVDVLDKKGNVIDTIKVNLNEPQVHDVCQCEIHDK